MFWLGGKAAVVITNALWLPSTYAVLELKQGSEWVPLMDGVNKNTFLAMALPFGRYRMVAAQPGVSIKLRRLGWLGL